MAHGMAMIIMTEEERVTARNALIAFQYQVYHQPVAVEKMKERADMVQQLGFVITKMSSPEEMAIIEREFPTAG